VSTRILGHFGDADCLDAGAFGVAAVRGWWGAEGKRFVGSEGVDDSHVSELVAARAEIAQLREALVTNRKIAAAQGVLMASRRVGEAEASTCCVGPAKPLIASCTTSLWMSLRPGAPWKDPSVTTFDASRRQPAKRYRLGLTLSATQAVVTLAGGFVFESQSRSPLNAFGGVIHTAMMAEIGLTTAIRQCKTSGSPNPTMICHGAFCFVCRQRTLRARVVLDPIAGGSSCFSRAGQRPTKQPGQLRLSAAV
jgi:hypothetical protein